MKVKDFVSIMNPWQDLIVKKQGDTQLDEPLFQTEMSTVTSTWTRPDHIVSEMDVVELESSWGTTILYVV